MKGTTAVATCSDLDLHEKLHGKVMLCPGMSGIHIESATRAEKQ